MKSEMDNGTKMEEAPVNDPESVREDEKCIPQADNEAAAREMEELKSKLEEKSKKCEEYFGMLQRAAAEFDNYKKRTAREKEALCADTIGDVMVEFLPVVDNLERALQASDAGALDVQSLKEGIELVYRQLKDVFKKLGLEEINSVGEKFDPQLHNAVMHISDESCEENVVVEEFQKGYSLKGRVIRHSIVKVAN